MAKTNPNCIPCNRPKEKINMKDLKPKEKVVVETDKEIVDAYNKKYSQNLETSQLTDSMRNIIKKKLLLLFIIFLFIGCSTDEVQTTDKQNTDCRCGVIIEASWFQGTFSVFKVKNNCTGEIKQFTQDGKFVKGQEYCY